MKKTIISVGAAAALLAFGPAASALVYNNADLLLIFHQDGYDDCEFDLGPVSNYLSMTPGTKVALNNWSSNLVIANYGSFTAANFILMAAAPLQGPSNFGADADWLTCSDGSLPVDLTGSTFAGQNGIIGSVGNFAAANSSDAATNGYAVPTSIAGSYTWVITGGGVLDEQTLGGTAAFSVQQSIPGTSSFFQIGASDSASPPAAVQVGSFTIDAGGDLTFIAGAVPVPPPAPTVSVRTAGGVNTISFVTSGYAKYRLRYSSDLSIPVANWPVIGGSITGNGSNQTLQDTTSATRYYVVEAYY